MARNTGQRQQNGVHDMRENDLVRFWRLDAHIHDKVTTHTTSMSDSTLGIRAKEKVTKWKYESQLGSGQTGTVHLESQLEAPHNKRAVKVINKKRGLDIFSELRFLGITSKVRERPYLSTYPEL